MNKAFTVIDRIDQKYIVKCNKCGKLYDLKQPDFSMLTGTEDFEIKQVHLYCWGLCPDCKSENTSVNEDFNNYKQ